MNKTINKSKLTLIVVIICFLLTVGVTVGVCLNNYYLDISYKEQYLDDYFGNTDENPKSNQTKIENIVKFESLKYLNAPGEISFRDPSTGEAITSEKLSSGNSLENSYYDSEIGVLHLENYFDVHIYARLVEADNGDGSTEKELKYSFYFSNICYTYLTNFNPECIAITLVDGIGEEADDELDAALEEMEAENASIGNLAAKYHNSFTSIDGDTYGRFVTDNARDDANVYEDGYYIYALDRLQSYDNSISFGSVAGVTFSIYYYNDTYKNKPTNIVEGTFVPNFVNNSVVTAESFEELEGIESGYNKSFYQDSYKEFMKPILVKTGLIAFGITAVVTAILAFIWIYNPEQEQQKKEKNLKKKKR